MPWYGFIHPVLAVLTLIYGIILGQVSLSRLGEWDFPLRRVRTQTIIYFSLVVVNLFLGLWISTILSGRGEEVKIFGHLPLAIISTALIFLAALVTFGRSQPGKLTPFMRWHPIVVVLSLALIMTMGFTAILKLLKL
ncbi:MAG: hypothetical protein ABIK39_04715 [candidate division WOR-3 bacterium]